MQTDDPVEESWESKHLSDEIFRLLVDGVRDYAIYMLDCDGYVRSWNAGAERAKFYKSSEIVGRHFSTFYTPEDLANGRPKEILRLALKDGRVEDEGWRVRKDGSRFWADVVITAIYDADNIHIGYAKVTRDMSLQRQLIESREEAVTASQAKSAFLANMSHELRTPLTAILGYADLLHDQLQELNLPELAEDVSRIQFSGQHLLSIVSDILDLSKVEAGRLELHPEEVNLPTVIANVAEAIEPLAICNGSTVSTSIEDDTIGNVLVDQIRLRQILYNLLSNAAKFTLNGLIQIRLSTYHSNPDADPYIQIDIEDNGVGMTREQASSIFDRFYQVETHATQLNKAGTGLGLAISRMLCTAMGGTIAVESAEGKGSTFTVLLPKR